MKKISVRNVIGLFVLTLLVSFATIVFAVDRVEYSVYEFSVRTIQKLLPSDAAILITSPTTFSGGTNTMDAVTVTGTATLGTISTGTADGLSTRQILRATFDGGTHGAIGTNSLGVTIPDNAVVYDGYIDITDVVTGTGVLATVGIDMNVNDDIFAADTVTNAFKAVGIIATVPLGSAATAVKSTAARAISAVVGTEPVTGGTFTVVLEYDLQAN